MHLPVIVQGTLGVASAILSTAGLSFIGLGVLNLNQNGELCWQMGESFEKSTSYYNFPRSCHYDNYTSFESFG